MKTDSWQQGPPGPSVLGGSSLATAGRSVPPPHVLPQCLAQCGPVYLEPFELAFHIYFQGREHGLLLVGQVLESVQATLTVSL